MPPALAPLKSKLHPTVKSAKLFPMADIPLWKKWLSHLTPLTLEEAASEYNPELSVVLDKGRLQLMSGNAIYSWDDLYRNFTTAFEQLKPENRAIQDVLLLGLGLGSVPYILEKKHHTQFHYTAVELDETVAELASRYTLSRLKSPVEIVTADAEIFVQVTEEQYDMIVVDIFEDNTTPEVFESLGFLEVCNDLLRPNGLLLYNRLCQNPADLQRTSEFFEQVFKAVFPNAIRIDTGGNWILVSGD
jgi:predicted membrane-bound spermidine synthase